LSEVDEAADGDRWRAPPNKSPSIQTYLKALSIRDLSDVEVVQREVRAGNIVIAKITEIANRSAEDTRRAIDALCAFTREFDCDIARLGVERVVVTPPTIKIWRR
jgi:SepF-like predicted cell division protein (DUF552 family)